MVIENKHGNGFMDWQLHWVGSTYYKQGPEGNDVHKTNVPNVRVEFRHEVRFL